jgi:hypothetical protein
VYIYHTEQILAFNSDMMGNKCVTPCSSTTPNLKNRIRCLYFCCLSGANINVIQPPTTDEVDYTQHSEEDPTPVSVYIDTIIKKVNGSRTESTGPK